MGRLLRFAVVTGGMAAVGIFAADFLSAPRPWGYIAAVVVAVVAAVINDRK